MASTRPYTFQPQPPPLPRTTGGKRGPSGPINIASSSSEDEDSDQSITDFSPPVPSRLSVTDLASGPSTKSNAVITVSSLSSPRNNFVTKKSTGLLPSPRSLSNASHVISGSFNHSSGSSSCSSGSNSLFGSNTISSGNGINVANHGAIGQSVTTTTTTPLINNANSSTSSSLPPAVPGPLTIQAHSTLNNKTSAFTTQNSLTSNATNSTASSSITCGNNAGGSSSSSSDNGNATNSANTGSLVAATTSSSASSPSSRTCSVPEAASTSPRERSCSPASNFAYEHDHDYENVASPCSSTASGPTYVRPPGFNHHAQEITVSSKNKLKKKKSSAAFISVRDGFKKREATPPKIKPKREPLPMKLRALPQSFWQQPNVAHQVSPATLFPILPPLSQKESEEIMDVRPVTPPEDRDSSKKAPPPERKLTVANTDLLFKLFDGVTEEKKSTGTSKSRTHTRQRKTVPKSSTKGLFLGNDPYLVEDVTDKIFPTLTLEGSRHLSGGGNTSLQLITLKEGDRTVTLPSLSMEQSYPQMLSELVMHI
ncbi:uncharacterized protein DDB_G0271670 [Aplysia californica]|uniref:Uncharacterized protein DDB_G0271670 n=1 Tax=Aplysia californica TaxID=6500 RepID=A0ABM1AB24_APLCA|nr:uncharacterized protein DDB_G0271670 [Aplysia californica]